MNFKEWYEDFYGVSATKNTTDCFGDSECAWNACKKEVLKQLKGFEGEYVCDVIDKIKEL